MKNELRDGQSRLKQDDVHWIAQKLPSAVIRQIWNESLPNFVIAGGFVRDGICGEKPSDIDLFSPSKADAESSAAALSASIETKIHRTDNALTLTGKPRIQFITRWTFETIGDLIASFDYTIAMCCVWFSREENAWHGACHRDFYADLAAKRLVYTSPIRDEEAGGSMLRACKFLRRGYSISPEDMAAVMARVFMKVKTDKFGDTSESAEAFYARVIAGELREVDPNIVRRIFPAPQREAI